MNSTQKTPDQAYEDKFAKIAKRIEEHYDEVEAASKILPAWFTMQMMADGWQYGLMLSTGRTLGISRIIEVSQDAAGGIWIDALLLESDAGNQSSIDILTAPCPELRNVSINASHVVAAFEIAAT